MTRIQCHKYSIPHSFFMTIVVGVSHIDKSNTPPSWCAIASEAMCCTVNCNLMDSFLALSVSSTEGHGQSSYLSSTLILIICTEPLTVTIDPGHRHRTESIKNATKSNSFSNASFRIKRKLLSSSSLIIDD